jgi:hypothetical protein
MADVPAKELTTASAAGRALIVRGARRRDWRRSIVLN